MKEMTDHPKELAVTIGLRYTYMAFFLDGTTFPEGIFIN